MSGPPPAPQGLAAGLEIRGLGKTFGGFVAVDAVDLLVRRGEFLTLLGPSGSGKTTLLMMIAGFLDPTAGTMTLDGRDVTVQLPEQRNFGMVFQGYALFPHMTVSGNIAYPLEVRRMPRAAIKARVAEMLELVQLAPFADRYPRQLSGGQQQRVALARALSFKPSLLLLDEPLGALDRKLRGDVQEELKDLHRKTGATFVYVTHDQDEALSMSDRIAIMNKGRIVQLGTPGELYERPRSVFAASFLGKSNFFDADIVGADERGLACNLRGFRFRQNADGQIRSPGTTITLALRPEKLAIIAGPTEVSEGNKVQARITHVTYFGPLLELRADAGALGTVTIHAPAWRNAGRYSGGENVWLHWADDAAVIVERDLAPDKT